ncbi:cell division protein SepF [Ruminococcaceae bacterium AM07-15]|nr:cell division protein SepF [Ruminococcaceae bacterium AM07-15]
MSFIDDLKHWARGDEDEDEEELEEEEFVAPTPAPSRPEPDNDRAERAARRNNKVVNINTTTQLSVVLVKPEKFENAAEIADNLRQRRTVVLNLEDTAKEPARRLVDFLSGVTYALDGKIKKVAASTYIITPYNVDILGDLIDELENNGLYI